MSDLAFDVEASLVRGKQPAIREGRIELVHTINGEASPDVPALHVAEGQRVLLHLVRQPRRQLETTETRSEHHDPHGRKLAAPRQGSDCHLHCANVIAPNVIARTRRSR